MHRIITLLAVASVFLVPAYAGPENLLKSQEKSAIYIEPVTLTEVQERIGFRLNVGAVVSNSEMAKGLQKAADVYGLKLDVFVEREPAKRRELARMLVENKETYLIVDKVPGDTLSDTLKFAGAETRIREIPKPSDDKQSLHEQGFSALREARSALMNRIPKYDEILPLAFPISPLPDNFFQPSKFPYPTPLVRAARTNESVSASVHAHTSCNMVAQTGNMLHRTSSVEPNRLLMGMEGGNLSLQALPGALDKSKISAVMTSWVLNLADGGKKREILVENNGLESSFFQPGIHAPEELEIGLSEWRRRGFITGFRIIDHESVRIEGWEGRNLTMRAGLFLVANDRHAEGPVLIPGRDRYGARTIDFFSTQEFVQQLVEVLEHPATGNGKVEGGLLTSGGGNDWQFIWPPFGRTTPGSSASFGTSSTLRNVNRGRLLGRNTRKAFE